MSLRFAASSPGVLATRELALLRRREQPAVADLADVQLQRVVGGRAGETREARAVSPARPAATCRLFVRRVEEMLGCIAFHGGCIGRAVAPLEG